MVLMIVLLCSAEGEGNPHLSVGSRKLKIRRRNANHSVRLAVEPQCFADNSGIRREMPAPVLVTKDCGLALARDESTAEDRIDTKQVKQIR